MSADNGKLLLGCPVSPVPSRPSSELIRPASGRPGPKVAFPSLSENAENNAERHVMYTCKD